MERYSRSPHAQPIGQPTEDESALADEFLRLGCLNYGGDDPARWERARELLDGDPWLSGVSIYTAAAAGDVGMARDLLAGDPASAGRPGGPFAWEPLLYLTYSRIGDGPGRSAVEVARLLLGHGADPNIRDRGTTQRRAAGPSTTARPKPSAISPRSKTGPGAQMQWLR